MLPLLTLKQWGLDEPLVCDGGRGSVGSLTHPQEQISEVDTQGWRVSKSPDFRPVMIVQLWSAWERAESDTHFPLCLP